MKYILLFFLISISSFAQTDESLQSEVMSRFMMENHQSNEKEREGKRYGVSLGAFVKYSGYSSQSIQFDYYYDQNNLIGLGYTHVPENIDFHYYKADVFDVSWKHFTSDTFYITSSLYYRDAEEETSQTYRFSLFYDEDFGVTTNTARYQDMGVGLTIGNQWQWENFNISCNWIGVNQSLVTLSNDRDERDTDFRKRTLTLLNLNLGWAF